MENTMHLGRNIKRFREMMGIKQEGLALELGDGWNQRKKSILEQKEVIDPEQLDEVAKVLKVPVEPIKNFDAEQVIHTIINNFHDNSIWNQFNPLEKIIELYEVKIVSLYERMLQIEMEKYELLQRLPERNR